MDPYTAALGHRDDSLRRHYFALVWRHAISAADPARSGVDAMRYDLQSIDFIRFCPRKAQLKSPPESLYNIFIGSRLC